MGNSGILQLEYGLQPKGARVRGMAILLLIIVPTVLLTLAWWRAVSTPIVLMGPPERQTAVLDRRRDQTDRLALAALAWVCASSAIGYRRWHRSAATT